RAAGQRAAVARGRRGYGSASPRRPRLLRLAGDARRDRRGRRDDGRGARLGARGAARPAPVGLQRRPPLRRVTSGAPAAYNGEMKRGLASVLLAVAVVAAGCAGAHLRTAQPRTPASKRTASSEFPGWAGKCLPTGSA